MLLSPAMELNRLESTTAVKVIRVLYRGLWVHPYPRVYLTRPLVGLLRVTGIPAAQVENLTYGYGSVQVTIS